MADLDYWAAGRRALRALETRTLTPREPRDRAEVMSAFAMLAALIEGYKPSA